MRTHTHETYITVEWSVPLLVLFSQHTAIVIVKGSRGRFRSLQVRGNPFSEPSAIDRYTRTLIVISYAGFPFDPVQPRYLWRIRYIRRANAIQLQYASQLRVFSRNCR